MSLDAREVKDRGRRQGVLLKGDSRGRQGSMRHGEVKGPPEEWEGTGMLRAQGSWVSRSGAGKVGSLHSHHICPSSSPDIQTLYSGLRGWGLEVVSLIPGEQEP